MMNMLIKLDEERIIEDGEYDLNKMWGVIDKQFEKCFTKVVQSDRSVLYVCDVNKDYFTEINLAVWFLEDQKWFAEYCAKWIWYDNDDDEDLPMQDIDVLARQRANNLIFPQFKR